MQYIYVVSIEYNLHRIIWFRKENIHSKKETLYTDSNLHRYIIVPVEYILYGYQESELNHMAQT